MATDTHLPRGLDAFDHSQANKAPGHQQTQGHLPVEPSALRDGVGDVQGLAVPEVGGGRAPLAFGLHNCNRAEAGDREGAGGESPTIS